jgi:FOG: WD40-like repeat
MNFRQAGKPSPLTAPQKLSPALICQIELESIRPHGGSMGTSPDTELSFSPDGTRLAIGSFHGYLRIVDTISGKVLLKHKIAEGMVKRLAWGELNGRPVLYVGEQSPDSNLYCLDAATGEEIWRRRLADEVGSGRMDEDQRHAIYNLPGVYYLRMLPGGDVFCVATFGRYEGERFIHDCRLYCLEGVSGQIRWLWPRQVNLPQGITWVGASRDGGTLAFICFNTFGEPGADPKYPTGSLFCLDGREGRLRWSYRVPPLRPYYERVGSWQGVAVSPDGRYIPLGLNDGRGMLFKAAGGEPLWVKDLGAPVLVGEVPVAAPLSYAAMSDRIVYFATPGTTIPSGSGNKRARRPPPHPRANYFIALDLSGDIAWQQSTQGSSQGIFLSKDGRLVATAVGQGDGYQNLDQYGVTLFHATRPGRASQNLLYHYSTEGPAFFRGRPEPGRPISGHHRISLSPQKNAKRYYGPYRGAL